MKLIIKFLIYLLVCVVIIATTKFSFENYDSWQSSSKSNIEYQEDFYENYEVVDNVNNVTSYKPMLSREDIAYPVEPKTYEDFVKLYLYMANENILEIEIEYKESYKKIFEDNKDIQNNANKAYEDITNKYVDLFSGLNYINLQMSGNMFSSKLHIKLSSKTKDDASVIREQVWFEKQCEKINDALYEKEYLSNTMSDKEKAKVLFAYITRTLKYDLQYNSESFTGYGAAMNEIAVCQGYTAMYNYLLKLNNIECYGQSGETLKDNTAHIWTVAILDGQKTYIDTTFGDPVPDRKGYSNFEYFDASKQFLSTTRTGVE